MFRCNRHHQGAHYLSLLKLQLLKRSIKIHWLNVNNLYQQTHIHIVHLRQECHNSKFVNFVLLV